MVVLITGFEPFGEFPVNTSREMIQAMQQDEKVSKLFPFETCILPVERKRSFEVLSRYLEKKLYSHIFLMGMAAYSEKICIEKVAINWSHFTIPDNAYQQPLDECIESEAPDAYFSNMPVLSLVKIKTTHIPIQLSLSAGSYVCNDLYFRTLHWINVHHYPAKIVFLHLPGLISSALYEKSSRPAFSKEAIYDDLIQILSQGVSG